MDISLFWQLFDIHTSGLLAEIPTGHHSTIQYCDFSPYDHLAVVALSQYCVEVSRWMDSVECGSLEIHGRQRNGLPQPLPVEGAFSWNGHSLVT